MVSESVIAEARRKALRNGEEDPVAVAQRYLNVYRQMHIFSQEKKDEFDQSLLNLQPITISIISSLPGGLTFQDYIDEVLTKSGRAKSAREGGDDEPINNTVVSQPQILSNAQASVQPQQVIAPVMSGEAKLSMGKEFADEFAKIMSSIVAKQTIMQKDSLAKVAQDLGKTQMFIAKKLEDNRVEHQAEISELCKTIAQSHTALSTSLATLGENITNQRQDNTLVQIPSVERSAADDARLVEMITQSQERMMSGLLAKLPQAVGVGNVNVTAPSRSLEDDARLAEMIARSQERMMAGLLARLPQVSGEESSNANTPVRSAQDDARLAEMIAQSQERVLTKVLEKLPQSNENYSSAKSSENVEEIIAVMAQSQEKLISTLAERLPQMSAGIAPAVVASSGRSTEDDERLVEMITKSQEKLISALIEKIPQPAVNQNIDATYLSHSKEDDERLIRLIASTQENMINSLIEKNILVTQGYHSNSAPAYNTYQNTSVDNNQYYYNSQVSENSEYQNYVPTQNADSYNQDNVDFDMFIPVDKNSDVSSIIYGSEDTYQPHSQQVNNDNSLDEYFNGEQQPETKKKKKKKKKKKNNNSTDIIETNGVIENIDDGLSFLDDIEDNNTDINFDDIKADTDFDKDNYIDSNEGNQTVDALEEAWINEPQADSQEMIDFENITPSQDVDEAIELFDADADINVLNENIGKDDYLSESVEDTEDDTSFVDVSSFRIDASSDIDDNETEFDDKWLNFDDEDLSSSDSNKSYIEEDTSKANWNTEDDSWGFESNDTPSKDIIAQEDEGWEYVEDNGEDYSEEEGWEYVEDDGSYSSDDYEWEYVEDDGDSYSGEDWEYVEAIDDNAQIYSSDSYSQQTAPVANIFSNKKERVQITNIPQIHNETSDDEIDDPYKNSILKD